MFKKFFSVLQRVGKSLMLPVSVLPAAGLLVALSRVMMGDLDVSQITSLDVGFIPVLGSIFYSAGIAIFENLSLVFAIGVAIGFAGGSGVAGLAAVVGYFSMTNVLATLQVVTGSASPIDMGVFGGIYIGLFAAYLYNKYHKTELPQVLGFFSGKRLVPILTAIVALFSGILFAFLWPPIQDAINTFGASISDSAFGPAFYAGGKRALIPFGLHHVYYPPFLYEFGEFVTAGGEILRGDSVRYFAGDPTAGYFMASEFPIMLFGLPAACLAMWLRAKPEKRALVGGGLLSAALTSIITGITEPIEFIFIFLSPVLYVFHVVGAFISGFLTNLFGVRAGYTFSASLIDLVVGYFNTENVLALLIIGLIIGAFYFCGFYFLIPILDVKTPGREDEDLEIDENSSENPAVGSSDKAAAILEAFGGK